MRAKSLLKSRVTAFVAGGAVIAIAGIGTAEAASQITSAQIKDGTIQTRDLTKNNFARFTSTETVVSATTPGNAALGGAQAVPVAANTPTPLASITLNKGTWKLSGNANFYHLGTATPNNPDYGYVGINGLSSGLANSFTGDVPDGTNPASTSFSGTITITANGTPVTVYGAFTGGNAGQAGASLTATQYVYVQQPSH